MPDAHANFAYSLVAAAPSPPLSGTSLTLMASDGALFPDAPFNVTVWPPNVAPRASNAEVVRVTAKVGDVLTISRTQEGSAAQAIAAGWQVAATITRKTLTDIETDVDAALVARRAQVMTNALGYFTETFTRVVRPTTQPMISGRRYYVPFPILAGEIVNGIDFGCHAAGSGLTLVKFGVKSLDAATLHATSGDEKAQFTTTGLKPMAMLTPYESPIDQVLYGVGIAVGSGMPTGDAAFGSGRNSNGKKTGAAAAPAAYIGLQADLVAGGTPVSDAGAVPYWMGFW